MNNISIMSINFYHDILIDKNLSERKTGSCRIHMVGSGLPKGSDLGPQHQCQLRKEGKVKPSH